MSNDLSFTAISLAKEAGTRREELQRGRRIPSDLSERAGDAGLFRQLLSTELGGLGRGAADWFRLGVDMVRWEPSFSWIITQAAGDMATYVAAADPSFTTALLISMQTPPRPTMAPAHSRPKVINSGSRAGGAFAAAVRGPPG